MEQVAFTETNHQNDAHGSGVSWGAVIAGAAVASALSLSLLALGTGIGFSSVSPWANSRASGSAIGWSAVIWMVLMQIIASSMGGYLAGRLRTRWINVHTHEVYFRDTAHGFLVWAVGLVVTAAFLTSAAASVVGGPARSGGRDMASREDTSPYAYYVETLLRTSDPTTVQNDAQLKGAVELIFANGLRQGSLLATDKAYLALVVAARSGAGESEASKRVEEAFVQTQDAADQVRKAIAHSLYWTFLALLVGAFCASFAATVGGRQRDQVQAI